MDIQEASGLLNNNVEFPAAMKNFLVMSVNFGIVHGAITVAIAYGNFMCATPCFSIFIMLL
jgi:hypothetical protein